MVAGRPWYKRNPGDFLMATAHYDLETKGAYSTIIDLLNDRDRPLPDDPRFIAGALGCSVQKWRKIKRQLIADNKLIELDGGYLTNPRFEREKLEREAAREKARAHGRAGGIISAARRAGQSEFDLDQDAPPPAPNPKKRKKVERKLEKSSNLVATPSRFPKEKSNEINDPPQAPPSASRGRESPEYKSNTDSNSNVGDSDRPKRNALDRPDLKALLDQVCLASGYRPISPAQIDRAMTQIQDWVKMGCDFDAVVIPTIESVIAQSDDKTLTLGRFRVPVAHAHARWKKNMKPKAPAEKPILEFPEESDQRLINIRKRILQWAGESLYAISMNHVRLEIVEAHILRVNSASGRNGHLIENLVHGQHAASFKKAAAEQGFSEVWKGQ